MDKLIEQIITGKASDAASLVESTLNKKLKKAIKEHKTVVAEKVYGAPSFSQDVALPAAQMAKEDERKSNAAAMWGFSEAELNEYGNRAAVESKIKLLQAQIKTQGDQGGSRRSALRKLEDQLKGM